MALGSYYVTYAKVKCTDIGIYPVSRPSMPTPVRRAQKLTIPGRDGDLYVEDGAIEDIQIQITFGFYGPANDWGDTFRALKAWAANRDYWLYTRICPLQFSDDANYFFDVKRTIVQTSERVARTIGRATVTFVCEGWSYLYAGSYPTPIVGTSVTLTNTGTETAYPTILMSVPNPTTFTVTHPDSTTDTFTFTGSPYATVIDTRRQIIYHNANGDSILNRTTGDFDAFLLYPGATTISLDVAPTSFSVYPLWRVL